MRAKIFQPARSSMSSGMGKTKSWVLEFPRKDGCGIDPMMGWTSSDDPQTQVRLNFDSRDAAIAYAKAHGFQVSVSDPHKRKQNIRPGGYGDNFATNRRTVWTH